MKLSCSPASLVRRPQPPAMLSPSAAGSASSSSRVVKIHLPTAARAIDTVPANSAESKREMSVVSNATAGGATASPMRLAILPLGSAHDRADRSYCVRDTTTVPSEAEDRYRPNRVSWKDVKSLATRYVKPEVYAHAKLGGFCGSGAWLVGEDGASSESKAERGASRPQPSCTRTRRSTEIARVLATSKSIPQQKIKEWSEDVSRCKSLIEASVRKASGQREQPRQIRAPAYNTICAAERENPAKGPKRAVAADSDKIRCKSGGSRSVRRKTRGFQHSPVASSNCHQMRRVRRCRLIRRHISKVRRSS